MGWMRWSAVEWDGRDGHPTAVAMDAVGEQGPACSSFWNSGNVIHDIWVLNVSILMFPLCWLHRDAAVLWCHRPRHSGVKCQQCGDTEASAHVSWSVTHSKPLELAATLG